MQGAHNRLSVHARSTVAVRATTPVNPSDTPPWDAALDPSSLPLDAIEYLFDSTLPRSTAAGADLAGYARPSFAPGRPLIEAVVELTRRIHEDFTYDPRATTVATPLADVFRSRRGVCQDFAHLEIACLRSLGLSARYVSGYLETVPLRRYASARRRRRVPCVARRVLPRGRLDRCRPHQQPVAVRYPRDAGVGTRVRRCQPDSGGDPGGRGPLASGQRGSDASGNVLSPAAAPFRSSIPATGTAPARRVHRAISAPGV